VRQQDASPDPACEAPAIVGREEEENPGLPLLHNWPRVYIVVLASFILWVVLLILLTFSFR